MVGTAFSLHVLPAWSWVSALCSKYRLAAGSLRLACRERCRTLSSVSLCTALTALFTGLWLQCSLFLAHDCWAVLEGLLFSPQLLHVEIACLSFSLLCFHLPSFTPSYRQVGEWKQFPGIPMLLSGQTLGVAAQFIWAR